jgi:hypothetical protein
MVVFVVDASVALAWCFEDEATNWTEEFLERLRQGDRIIVPAHWAKVKDLLALLDFASIRRLLN